MDCGKISSILYFVFHIIILGEILLLVLRDKNLEGHSLFPLIFSILHTTSGGVNSREEVQLVFKIQDVGLSACVLYV